METSNVKNMLILKSLPSNIVEEAIIILKKNINAKELELQKNTETKNKKNLKPNEISKKGYIVKEAELIVNNYISKIETNKKKEQQNAKIKNKYNKMKKYIFSLSITTIIELILLIIK